MDEVIVVSPILRDWFLMKTNGWSPAELAAAKAEQRRQVKRQALLNDIGRTCGRLTACSS